MQTVEQAKEVRWLFVLVTHKEGVQQMGVQIEARNYVQAEWNFERYVLPQIPKVVTGWTCVTYDEMSPRLLERLRARQEAGEGEKIPFCKLWVREV